MRHHFGRPPVVCTFKLGQVIADYRGPIRQEDFRQISSIIDTEAPWSSCSRQSTSLTTSIAAKHGCNNNSQKRGRIAGNED